MINFVFASVFYEFLFLVVLPFVIWVISWWGYISGKFVLTGDAFYYYWDSRFFLENISHGVYPLWNPGYSGGAPWNFFLRRMGEDNPFYWITSSAKLLGASTIQAHLIFLVLYYFLGLVGFWLLARLFLKDRLTSTAAYLLLLFSWGGQLFYCFEVLLFVPLVWFFYFIFAFAQEKKKHLFLGACFAAALMVTTYIPFFTLTIIFSFLFFLFLFFMKEFFDFFKATRLFLGTHKWFAVMSLGFFLIACIPTIDFYFESRAGGFVMPSRHLGSTDPSQIAVSTNVSNNEGGITYSRTVWDIIAYGNFDKIFSNQQEMTVSNFNIAYLIFIVPLLAIINPFSRRTSLLLVTTVFMVLIAMTKGRLYPFLLEHVFFFRYMRMLHLFIWLAVLPMAILLVMEQLRVFLQNHRGRKDIRVLAFVTVVHVLFIAWLCTQEGVVWSSYLAVGMSLIFFILGLMGWTGKMAADSLLWLSLIIQPVTFAYYIDRNSAPCDQSIYNDYSSHFERYFSLPSRLSVKPVGRKSQSKVEQEGVAPGYYENPWFSSVRQSVSQDIVRRFLWHKLLFFDNTVPEDKFSTERSYVKLAGMWKSLQNLVFLPQEGSVSDDFQSLAPHTLKTQVLYDDTPLLKVLFFDANTLRLQTFLDRPRFLLWANGYHPGWNVYIDGHKSRLLRADYAFKGVWIPSGEHKIVFRFATPMRYAAAYVLMIAFVVVLVMIVVLGVKEGFLIEKEVALGQ